MAIECLGVFMLKVGTLFLFIFSIAASAGEFSHLKLHPQFEEVITRPRQKHITAKGLVDQRTIDQAVLDRFHQAIFSESALVKTDWPSPIPSDGEESLLYAQIRAHLEAAYEDIGRAQVGQINLVNRQFNLGDQNFSGFSWQKPFGVIQVYTDRQVTPNLFGSNWLVQDTFVFDIEASTFLEKLAESGLVNMNAEEIGAFAGITFKRVYTYYHYANSYQEGLSANFAKLFLPFVLFNHKGLEDMAHEEIIKMEDFWSARAGGIITSPSYYGFSAAGGVLGEVAYQKTTSAQSTHTDNDESERYRISVKGKTSASVGTTLALQLDFFKLLKFTLLNFDLNYEYAKAAEYNLAFNRPQWEQIKKDSRMGNEMRWILRGQGKVESLEPYVVRLDESSSSSMEMRGSALIWGKLSKTKTEQIRVIKDGVVKVFFKNYAQNIKVVQNVVSRLFSAVIYKLLKLPFGTSNAAIFGRNFAMEYEATHAQAGNPEVARIENSGQFSFVLTQSYDAARTDRWIDGRIKKDVVKFIDKFTTLPKEYLNNISSELLKGPLRVESNLRVEKAGFDYLLKTDVNEVWGKIARVCNSKKIKEWMNPSWRNRQMGNTMIGPEACVETMGPKFEDFKADYQANSLRPSLAKFKNFLTHYYKTSGNLADLVVLFGAQNTFINGRLQATTNLGTSFVTSFSAGQFRGLGVIDNFKRATGSRTPATISNE